MKRLFSIKRGRTCVSQTQPLDQLSEEILNQRKTAAEEMMAVIAGLMLLVTGMAIWSELYMLALTSIGMIPLFAEYLDKRKAIVKQLNKPS